MYVSSLSTYLHSQKSYRVNNKIATIGHNSSSAVVGICAQFMWVYCRIDPVPRIPLCQCECESIAHICLVVVQAGMRWLSLVSVAFPFHIDLQGLNGESGRKGWGWAGWNLRRGRRWWRQPWPNFTHGIMHSLCPNLFSTNIYIYIYYISFSANRPQ